MKINKEQQQAVDSRAKEILVSASAGTGKTTVLVERVLKLIKDDSVRVDELLILTFTNAAAKNMKDRLKKKLREAELFEQVELIDKADIMTIDAFANKLVSTYYNYIGWDPEFKLLSSELSKNKLRQATFDSVVQNFYKDHQQNTPLLQLFTNSKGDSSLAQRIFAFHDFVSSLENRTAWLDKERSTTQLESLTANYFEDYLSFAQKHRLELKRLAKHLKYFYGRSEPNIEEAPQKYKSLLNKLKAYIAFANSYYQLVNLLANQDFRASELIEASRNLAPIDNLNNSSKAPIKGIPIHIELSEIDFIKKNYYENDLLSELARLKKNKSKDGLIQYQDKLTDPVQQKNIEQFKLGMKKLNELIIKSKDYYQSLAEFNSDYSNKGLESVQKLQTDLELGENFLTVINERQHASNNAVEEFVSTFKNIKLPNYTDTKFKHDLCNPILLAYHDLLKNLVSFTIYEQQQSIKADFLTLYDQFLEAYTAKKQNLAVWEYADVEQAALAIISDKNNNVANELQLKYQEIIVDEYQDTNGLQEELLTQIAGHTIRRFMVGDVKQSIYAFRQADHTVFLKKEQDFKEENSPNKELITLKENYRSSQEVLDTINDIFKNLMTGETSSDLNYQGQELVAGNKLYKEKAIKNPLPAATFTNLEKPTTCTDDEAGATAVVNKIKELISSKQEIIDRKTGQIRPINYRDIAIITRGWTNSQVYFKAMRLAGIPFKVSRSADLLNKNEIQVVLAYLKIISNSHDDISLVAVLRSPLYDVNETELAFMRIQQAGSFYGLVFKLLNSSKDTLIDQAHNLDISNESDFINQLLAKLDLFKKDFLKLRALSYTTSLTDLVSYMLNQTDFTAIYSALPQGQLKRANLNGLIAHVNSLEEEGITNLTDLIDILSTNTKMEEVNQKFSADMVTYATIHGCKGLEFPFVFLIRAGNSFDIKRKDTMWNREKGIAFKSIFPSEEPKDAPVVTRFVAKEGPFSEAIWTLNKDAALAEEKRKLYVALTRAEQAFEVISIGKKKETYTNLISQAGIPFNTVSISTITTVNSHSEYKPEIKTVEPYSYPYSAISQISTRFKATEVKGQFSDQTKLTWTKNYDGHKESLEAEINPDVLGTCVHLIFERLDLTQGQVTLVAISKLMDELVAEGYADTKLAQIIEEQFAPKILAFFDSPLGQKIILGVQDNPTYLKREYPLTILADANNLYQLAGKDDFSIIHGTIDGLFYDKESKGYIIFDYKTDINLDEQKVRREKYDGQLKLYAAALEAMGMKVSACYLYGVRHNDFFTIKGPKISTTPHQTSLKTNKKADNNTISESKSNLLKQLTNESELTTEQLIDELSTQIAAKVSAQLTEQLSDQITQAIINKLLERN